MVERDQRVPDQPRCAPSGSATPASRRGGPSTGTTPRRCSSPPGRRTPDTTAGSSPAAAAPDAPDRTPAVPPPTDTACDPTATRTGPDPPPPHPRRRSPARNLDQLARRIDLLTPRRDERHDHTPRGIGNRRTRRHCPHPASGRHHEGVPRSRGPFAPPATPSTTPRDGARDRPRPPPHTRPHYAGRTPATPRAWPRPPAAHGSTPHAPASAAGALSASSCSSRSRPPPIAVGRQLGGRPRHLRVRSPRRTTTRVVVSRPRRPVPRLVLELAVARHARLSRHAPNSTGRTLGSTSDVDGTGCASARNRKLDRESVSLGIAISCVPLVLLPPGHRAARYTVDDL